MRIVIALGGNALGETPNSQKEKVALTTKLLLPLLKENHEIVFTHGNGPQVGLINDAFAITNKYNENFCTMPFVECGAMTQGYIGYHLQNALMNELNNNNIKKDVVTILTEVLVDKDDQAFLNPTKPVGLYMTKEQSEKVPYPTKESPNGKGYRRVVASPKPLKIIEERTIDNLLKQNNIVIACGGGGIPVINNNNIYQGIDAVIDKDFVSSVLAKNIQADLLIILTAVDDVSLNYRKENEIHLHNLSNKDIEKYQKDNHFQAGSMLPKVLACKEFVEYNHTSKAIITSIEKAWDAVNNTDVGTHIYFEK